MQKASFMRGLGVGWWEDAEKEVGKGWGGAALDSSCLESRFVFLIIFSRALIITLKLQRCCGLRGRQAAPRASQPPRALGAHGLADLRLPLRAPPRPRPGLGDPVPLQAHP